jgi:hypothetical protein
MLWSGSSIINLSAHLTSSGLISDGVGLWLQDATAINDDGQIAAEGYLGYGIRALGGEGPLVFLLTPCAGCQIAVNPAVPEPSTWAMMLIGFAGLGFAGYRRTKRNRASLTA